MIRLDEDAEVDALIGTSGETLWALQIGGPGNDTAVDVMVDGNDQILIAGTFTGTIDVGGAPLSSVGGTDVFVAKLSALDGQAIWAHRFGGSGGDDAAALGVDASNDVIVTGSFSGTVSFGGQTFPSAGSQDVYVVKLSGNDGSHVWSRAFGGSGYDLGGDVDTDSSGDVVVGGTFRSSITFGGATLIASGAADDVYLAKLVGDSGGHLWSRSFGSSEGEGLRDLAIDGAGDVTATGFFCSGASTCSCSLGGGTLVTAGYGDIFIAKYAASNGNHLFSRRFGGAANDQGEGLAVNAQGELVFVGLFEVASTSVVAPRSHR